MTDSCAASHPIPSHPIPSHPISSHTPSHPQVHADADADADAYKTRALPPLPSHAPPLNSPHLTSLHLSPRSNPIVRPPTSTPSAGSANIYDRRPPFRHPRFIVHRLEFTDDRNNACLSTGPDLCRCNPHHAAEIGLQLTPDLLVR
jgi:hypothetical protein